MRIIIFTCLLLCSFFTQAQFNEKETIYARLLSSSAVTEVKLGAKSLHHDLPKNQQLWDMAAHTLWQMEINDIEVDDEYEDTIAWLAKALGESENPRYRQLLNKILNTSSSKKVKRYVKKAIKNLNDNEVSQFAVSDFLMTPLASSDQPLEGKDKDFEAIQKGDTLESVLVLLGQPNGVGQYIRSYRRPFIGRQTFQNLRLSYINLGSMELKYEETHWVVDLKSKQTNADISEVAPEYRDLLSRLVSNDVTQIRTAAREAVKLPLTDTAALDHVAQYIWDNQQTDDSAFADSLAWLCKVLGKSQNGRYKEMLSTLAQKPLHSKITRYAANTAKSLTSTEPFFTPKVMIKESKSSSTTNL